MSTAIATRPDGSITTFIDTWEQRKQVAQTLISSGFLPPAFTKPEQVLAVMLTAHELHIPDMEALRSINVIQGKPTVSPQLMLALARRTGELEDIKFERTPNSIVCTVKRKGQSPFSATFGTAEATAMQLMGKDNYKKQPFTMFQWRALAANLRVTFGDAITGLYTPEELGADVAVTEEGEQVIVPSQIETIQPPALPESVNQATGEITAPLPDPVTVNGATFPTFDPMAEEITFGKHKGFKWGEIPADYLEWLAKNGKTDARAKAEATLKALAAVHDQVQTQNEWADQTFGPKDEPAIGQKQTDAFLKSITDAKSIDDLTKIGNDILKAKETGDITEVQVENIRVQWNARHAELKGASK
jgi:hypothetical protein